MSSLKSMARRFGALITAAVVLVATIGGATPAITWCIENVGPIPLVAIVAFALGFAIRDAWAHRLPPGGPAA